LVTAVFGSNARVYSLPSYSMVTNTNGPASRLAMIRPSATVPDTSDKMNSMWSPISTFPALTSNAAGCSAGGGIGMNVVADAVSSSTTRGRVIGSSNRSESMRGSNSTWAPSARASSRAIFARSRSTFADHAANSCSRANVAPIRSFIRSTSVRLFAAVVVM
jgi:hypothetical protein